MVFLSGGGLVAIFSQLFTKKKVDQAYQKGYEDASKIYEEKLKDQTQKFLSQKIILKDEIEEYQELIAEYDKYIDGLRLSNNPQEKQLLSISVDNREKLLSLPKESTAQISDTKAL